MQRGIENLATAMFRLALAQHQRRRL